MFPPGWPGLALLLLRVSVAIAVDVRQADAPWATAVVCVSRPVSTSRAISCRSPITDAVVGQRPAPCARNRMISQ